MQQDIDSGERTIVGVNKYIEDETDVPQDEYLQIDESIDEEQQRKLAKVKAQRDAAAVQNALQNLGKAIDRDDNLVAPIIEAVRHYATIGEICGVMRDKWGEFRESKSA